MRLRWLISLPTILTTPLFDHGFPLPNVGDDRVPRPQITQPNLHAIGYNGGSVSSVPSRLLTARVIFPPIILDNDWIVDHHDFTCLLPIVSAAAQLLDFYEDLVAFAAMTNVVPSQSFRIWVGDIMMEIMAPAGHEIQWISVLRFANWMIEMTRRGYINTYQINFVHVPTGLLLTFSLWVGYRRTMADVPS